MHGRVVRRGARRSEYGDRVELRHIGVNASSLSSTLRFFFMFTRSTARLLSAQTRAFSTSPARQTKVAVLGAGGGIGQPLSLLLKIDPLVSSLSLYDIRGAPGVAADVSHIDSNSSVCCLAIPPRHRYQHPTCQVKGYTADQLDEALDGAKVIVIPAGVPRKV